MKYEILTSFRIPIESPIIRLPDGQIISSEGAHLFDLGYYCFEVVELPVPQDHAVRCESLYQNWLCNQSLQKQVSVTQKELQDLVYLAISDGRYEPYITKEENRSMPMIDAFKKASERIVKEFIESLNTEKQ